MPMGLVSAGATFTRMMGKLLEGSTNLDSYLDDVLCHTKSWEDHMASLRDFFSRVRSANLRLKPSKCELGGNSVSFLGHKVTEDQRSPDNLNKIMEADRPQTKKQLMSFLGMANFHSSYIFHYSSIVAALTDCLKKRSARQNYMGGPSREGVPNDQELSALGTSSETSRPGKTFRYSDRCVRRRDGCMYFART